MLTFKTIKFFSTTSHAKKLADVFIVLGGLKLIPSINK